jgi:hypothetical protein
MVHVALLALASAAALKVWTRDTDKEKGKAQEVEIWSGSPENVESIALETKKRKVRVEPKSDGAGRYYVMRLEKEESATPHNPHGEGEGDEHGHEETGQTPPPATSGAPAAPPKLEKQAFIGVKAAGETIDKLSHMGAVRALGKLDAGRTADFGLDQPEATLKVKIDGKEHVLTVGGNTPGSAERYAKYGATGEVFAISGDLMQGLQFADTRLMEREFHAFEDEAVTRIRVTKGSKSRELVRVAGKQNAWADAATPAKADETVVNWLSKLERARIVDYVEAPNPPPGPDSLSVRLEYFAGPKNLGFFELYKLRGGPEGEYVGRTEHTRWYVKLLASAAEQADQDAAALFK